jgi:hypothetical protein
MSAQAADLGNIGTATGEEPQQERQPIEVATAFTVACSGDGVWVVLNDPNIPVKPQRAPTPDDMYAGCAVVQKDIAGQIAAMHTQRAMLQFTQQLQQQQQASSLASKLGNLRG